MPGIGKSSAERLDIFMGSEAVPANPNLEKLAARHASAPQSLCDDLADLTGFRSTTVAMLLIRAMSEGLIDPKTGSAPAKREAPREIDAPLQHSLFEPVQIDLFKV